MLDHPRLRYTDSNEPAVAVTLDPPVDGGFHGGSRETCALSTRPTGLVVDDLEYAQGEEVAAVTTRVIFLTLGATVSDENTDPVALVQRLRFPEGGKHPTDGEIDRVSTYLQNAEVDEDAKWLAEEIVSDSRLSEVMSPEAIRTKRERIQGLRGIAKDL